MSNQAKSQGVMRVVALETSGRTGSLATVRLTASQVEVVAQFPLPDDRRSAQSLLPALADILETSEWQANDLDLICATTGPGSFTGLRIGVTTAKTLAYATGAKLVGVNTLAAIAAGVEKPNKRVWAILDAQRQELFAACFPSGWQNQENWPLETLVIAADDWLGRLRSGDVVSGPPLKNLSERLPADVRMADSSHWSPAAAVVARLGIAGLERGEEIDPMQLVPHYYRKSAAEEKAEAGG
jgi:tRNA threonylcarbamoyladenosine biosynthesis protein TsaB